MGRALPDSHIRFQCTLGATRDSDQPFSAMGLVVLSVATSIDALAVSFTLAALNVPILMPVVIIGCVSLLFLKT